MKLLIPSGADDFYERLCQLLCAGQAKQFLSLNGNTATYVVLQSGSYLGGDATVRVEDRYGWSLR